MSKSRFLMIALIALAGLLAACGSDDDASDSSSSNDSASTPGASDGAQTDDAGAGDDGDSGASGDSGGSGGTLTIAGESIKLGSTLCFLEEQDSAGGGGKILFTAQASGVNADNEPVSIDLSRYDEDSQFAGDDISVTIGNPFSADAETLSAREATGAITIDGTTLSASDVTFSDDSLNEATGSFEINC